MRAADEFTGLEATGASVPNETELESVNVGLGEATLSPRSTLAGKTLQEIGFRNRFGLQVLAIWRAGRAYRSHLRNMKLQFGDGLFKGFHCIGQGREDPVCIHLILLQVRKQW